MNRRNLKLKDDFVNVYFRMPKELNKAIKTLAYKRDHSLNRVMVEEMCKHFKIKFKGD